MRYQTVSELPEPVRAALPGPAQELYRQAFNQTWDERAGLEETADERIEASHDAAWRVVERLSGQDPRDRWSPKAISGGVPGLGRDGERSSPVPDFRQGIPRKTSGTRKTTSQGEE